LRTQIFTLIEKKQVHSSPAAERTGQRDEQADIDHENEYSDCWEAFEEDGRAAGGVEEGQRYGREEDEEEEGRQHINENGVVERRENVNGIVQDDQLQENEHPVANSERRGRGKNVWDDRQHQSAAVSPRPEAVISIQFTVIPCRN